MVLCETKVHSSPFEGGLRHCDFTHCDFLLTFGLAGGLWCMWKDNASTPFILFIAYKSDRFMACNISMLAMNSSFVAIFIYAPPNHALKQEFWEELNAYLSSLNSPFMLLGDFNELSSSNDKLGGAIF